MKYACLVIAAAMGVFLMVRLAHADPLVAVPQPLPACDACALPSPRADLNDDLPDWAKAPANQTATVTIEGIEITVPPSTLAKR